MLRLWGLWGLVGMAITGSASAQTAWFTVTGNPNDPVAETVQVDPVAVTGEEATKTMNIRVSRASLRLNWDNVPYRSFESQVAFDCTARRADYLLVKYYMQPLWQGEVHRTIDYASNPRLVRFRDMEPNPTQRIVRAACRIKAR